MSSKGQIVIPKSMREGIEEGDRLVAIRTEKGIILEKMDSMNEKMKEDLEFERRTREALERVDRGEYTSYSSVDEFFESLESEEDGN